MANHKSAKKRIRSNANRAKTNQSRISRIRTFTKKVEVAILNGEVGEWAGRPQVRIGPGTKVVILRHSEETHDF